MAEGERSELTQLTLDLVDAMIADLDALVLEWGNVPFMQEALSRAEYERRAQIEQRLQQPQQMGGQNG